MNLSQTVSHNEIFLQILNEFHFSLLIYILCMVSVELTYNGQVFTSVKSRIILKSGFFSAFPFLQNRY